MAPRIPRPVCRLAPLALLLAAGACAPQEIRDDTPGRAQAFPPAYTQTVIPGGERRTWSEIQAEQNRASPSRNSASRSPAKSESAPNDQQQNDQPPPRRSRGSSSPPPDPAALPQPPRPVPLPPPASTQSATDAFKRDLIRPEVDRMRTDDAMGRLDPLGQRDLMKRENDLRQWGDPLAR